MTDDGIEIIAENMKKLRVLDISWCSRVTDASLEYVACDLECLDELVLDRWPGFIYILLLCISPRVQSYSVLNIIHPSKYPSKTRLSLPLSLPSISLSLSPILTLSPPHITPLDALT